MNNFLNKLIIYAILNGVTLIISHTIISTVVQNKQPTVEISVSDSLLYELPPTQLMQSDIENVIKTLKIKKKLVSRNLSEINTVNIYQYDENISPVDLMNVCLKTDNSHNYHYQIMNDGSIYKTNYIIKILTSETVAGENSVNIVIMGELNQLQLNKLLQLLNLFYISKELNITNTISHTNNIDVEKILKIQWKTK